MIDASTVIAGISALKNATDIAKLINDSGATLAGSEFKLKLAELLLALSEVKTELSEKDEVIRSLKADLILKENVDFKEPFYFHMSKGKIEGPFCQCCYDKDSKLVRLYKTSETDWNCKVCQNYYDANSSAAKSGIGMASSNSGDYDPYEND